MSIKSEPGKCPKCGGPISPEAPQGLCPKCLLSQASIPTEAGGGESSKAVPPTHEQLAAAFPQLEILELIGQGGMGFVFKARQPKIERLVALKILPQSLAADPAFAERFTREGRVLARLNHPNIVTIHDFGQAKGFFYILMEFVDGVNLRQAMRAGRFTPAQALEVVPKVCEALQFAHNEGILHRDIKPENILLDAKGRVKIADFGIAKLAETEAGRSGSPLPAVGAPLIVRATETTLTETGKVVGTPNYMAPEQLEKPNEVDHRADIYSLGVVFYEMLTGELPIGKFQPPSEKVRVDVRLDEVVLHALEKEPARRYQHVSEVKTAVDTITASVPGITPAPVSGVTPPGLDGEKRATLGFAKHLLRGAKIGFVVFLLITLAGAVITFLLPDAYMAVARIKVEPAAIANTLVSPSYDPYLIQSEMGLIQSEVILSRVIAELKLQERWEQRYGAQKPGLALDLLKQQTEIRPTRNTHIIDIRVYSEKPDEAAEIANAISENYLAYNSERLKAIRQSLQKANANPEAFSLPPAPLLIDRLEQAVPPLHPSRPNRPLNVFLAAAAGVLIGILTSMAAGFLSFWRALPAAPGKTASPATTRPDLFWRRFAIAGALVALAMILIPVAAILFSIILPAYQQAHARATAVHQQIEASSTPQKLPDPVFGPVIERTINRARTGSNFLLSFKTGELRAPPPENDRPAQKLYQWAHREGLDAAVGILNGDNDVMTGFDMATLPVPIRYWEELTPTDAAARLENQPASSWVVMLNANCSPLETCMFRTRAGAIGILQLIGYVSEPPGAKIRFKFVDRVLALSQTQSNPLVTDSWTPAFLPGEKPDLGKILEEAKNLTAAAHFEEALQRYLWHFQHAQEFGDSYRNIVRLTSALSDWAELGRRYPKAKQALIEIRDNGTREIAAGRGYLEIFKEVQAINHELLDDDATYALFKTIRDNDPKLVAQCFFYLQDLLVAKAEYQWCLEHLGDPQRRFESIRQGFDMELNNQKRTAENRQRTSQQVAAINQQRGLTNSWALPDTSATIKKSAVDRFVGQTCQLIEILIGAGHKADAEKIHDQALAVLDDARLKSAVSDGEKKIQRRSLRTGTQ